MSSPRANSALALAIALALHTLLGVALALYLSHAPAPDEFAQLDLTSIDLSLAETVGATADAVARAPAKPADAAICRIPEGTAPEARSADAVPLPCREDPVLPSLAEPIAELPAPPKVEAGAKDGAMSQEKRDGEPHRARVDAPPKPCRSIKPEYPRESRIRGEHGDVSLELDVAADGTVSDVRVLKTTGFPLLDKAAVKAARTARFTPAKSGGKPVACTVRLPLSFKLQ